ncbi:MAG: hypothetical protein IT201_14770 [Thermoleophilia bacterium]|nr:hypothetical protein [Thermoleophilia bacterium]
MHNAKAVGAFVAGLLALAVLVAAAVLPRFLDAISPLRALIVIPGAVVLALVSIALARRARFDFQRTLGRIGGDSLALTGWVLGIVALLVSLTAGLAVGVYAVLTFTQG